MTREEYRRLQDQTRAHLEARETLFTVQADRELTYESLRTAYGKLQVIEDAWIPRGMGFLFS